VSEERTTMADDERRLQELDAEIGELGKKRDDVVSRIELEADLAKREGREIDPEKREPLDRELKEVEDQQDRKQHEYDVLDRELSYRRGGRP
jgi:hypothetical protein